METQRNMSQQSLKSWRHTLFSLNGRIVSKTGRITNDFPNPVNWETAVQERFLASLLVH